MFKPNQIRAARALLGWQQKDLARIAEISELSVINIESGKTSPQQSTVDKILAAFALSGVSITDKKVEFAENSVVTLTGPNWFLKLLDDMEKTPEALRPEKDLGWVMMHVDESRVVPQERERVGNAAARGMKVQLFIEEGKQDFLHDPSIYRYIPKKHYHKDGLAVCYGDKLAMLKQTRERAHVSLYRNADLAAVMRNLSDLLWECLPGPSAPKKQGKKKS